MATGLPDVPAPGEDPEIGMADALPVVARGFADQMLAVQRELRKLDGILSAMGMQTSLTIVTRAR